jgi:hypothetical protein
MAVAIGSKFVQAIEDPTFEKPDNKRWASRSRTTLIPVAYIRGK